MWQANHREAVHAKLRQMFDEIVQTMDTTYQTFREDGREVRCQPVVQDEDDDDDD